MSGKKRLTPENRRAVIVSAALAVFADAGYDRASMRAVAKAAGITTPVLYDHFDSKADLYAALVESEADALISRWEQSGFEIPDGSSEDLFRETIVTIFDWVSANEAGWRIIFLDAPSDPAVAEAHRRRQERATSVLATQFSKVPHFYLSVPLDRERANDFLAEAAKWTVNAIAAWWWGNRDLSKDQIVELTSDLLWRGLGHVTGEPHDRR
ncbi:TetR/AcrR family transcriptional regulator [Actinophytocola algeriensis]|uniref:AcrR family transcriptional regulator n=1 Tax=Actinophytocola algeriensis TaxID=1768010 RepID=A0A7W7VBJ9_9PSEU|nr:TetR/AcrR family transcriptional regulator [Actinophytocola algeriensis]MBB4904051.1 AcrR family transcriptional regulator [Actinophytocola algeriensis]MBE1477092.1 AcrR family transcriptional regulator [Actinophytocola algeriensis]